MLIAGVFLVVFVALILTVFIGYATRIPKPLLKILGRFMLSVSAVESVLIVWVLVYVWNSDWSLWALSFNDFWLEQLTPIYFLKRWLYSWFWNDMLDVMFVFLPALVFLVLRTTLTTVIGFRSLAIANRG